MPNYQIANLLSGSSFPSGTTSLTYSFYVTAGQSAISDPVKNNFRAIFARLNDLLGVSFTEVASNGAIGITGLSTIAYSSEGSGSIFLGSAYDRAGDTNGFQNLTGSHGYSALVHEIGHVLGLKHPFDLPALPGAENNQTNSVMTYTFDTYEPGSFSRYDLQALQYLYGASAYNPGDTTYIFDTRIDRFAVGTTYNFTGSYSPSKQILWDSGGNDTLDFSALAASVTGYRFDLRPGGLLSDRSGYTAGTPVANISPDNASGDTMAYGTALAYNMTIENLINSSSNDEIILSGANNTILGYGAGRAVGNDTILNATPHDILDLSGYNFSEVTRTRIGNDLQLTLNGNGSVTVKDYYPGNSIRIAYKDLAVAPAPTLPTLSISDATVDENAGTVNLTVTLAGAYTYPVSVSYATNRGTAVAGGDYQPDARVLTFADGTTQKTISINLIDDTYNEGDETFSVDLSAPQFATLAKSRGTILVKDNDPLPQIAVSSFSKYEGSRNLNSNGTWTYTPFSFTLTLSEASQYARSFQYWTVAGTATEGSDYVGISGTITFDPYWTTKSLRVNVIPDRVYEPDETFSLVVKDPITGSTVSGTATIRNDETIGNIPVGRSAIEFESDSYQVTEGDRLNVYLVRDGDLSDLTSVLVGVVNGTAAEGEDITLTTRRVTFNRGSDRAALSLSATLDNLREGTEYLSLQLLGVGSKVLAGPRDATTLYILDAPPPFAAGDEGYLPRTTDTYLSLR